MMKLGKPSTCGNLFNSFNLFKALGWKSTFRVPKLSVSYVSPLLYVIKLSDFTLSLDIGWQLSLFFLSVVTIVLDSVDQKRSKHCSLHTTIFSPSLFTISSWMKITPRRMRGYRGKIYAVPKEHEQKEVSEQEAFIERILNESISPFLFAALA